MNDFSQQPRVYTVSEITRNIKKTLEGKQEFNSIWIKGEIFNLTFHSSGHIYFTLKDDDAVISAVFFRHANKTLSFKLKEGMSILAFGNITVFEKRGSYQINVSMVRPEGIGELQQRIEKLKIKLMKEGIFDPKHKRSIPFLTQRLGIVTSPTGAAVQDIIKVALRRYPNIEIIIAPAVVQGDDAPRSISRGIDELNRPEYRLDCIIAGRGGGSFEDLMPFNEEIVVRAFYNSRIPIISAVGHQIDHPLTDEAADMAAPTPSAAAEIAIPMKKEFMDEIDYFFVRANRAIASKMRDLTTRILAIRDRRIFRDPYEIISRIEITLSDAENRILASLKESVTAGRNRLLLIPDIRMLVKNSIKNRTHSYLMALKALDQLSPLAVMGRGYSIAFDDRDMVIRSVAETRVHALIRLLLRDGSLGCTVNFIKREKQSG
jgi:exodeoxyribonuclease VII large subunit